MKKLLLLVLPFALIAAACTSGDGGASPTDNAWQATGIAGSDGTLTAPVDIAAPTMSLVDGTADGNASCNQYSGTYEIDGSSITFGPMISTQMFCDGQELMDQEMAFLAALEKVDGWAIEDGVLSLTSGDATVLTFAAISQDLAGTSWDLLGYNNRTGGFESVYGDEPPTASFGEDGTLSGSAGCNQYNASWKTGDDGTIEIGPAAVTRMACPDEQLTMQETRYLELLELATTYTVSGTLLEVFDADGKRILQYGLSAG
jgi:heat shock protein HslJ